ncbi:hypothetical protein JCM9279_002636 [Rhodotorula babjevae]
MAQLAPVRPWPAQQLSRPPPAPPQRVPPSLLPSSTSRLQLALRAASRPEPTHAASSAPCTCVVPLAPSGTSTSSDPSPAAAVDELSWAGRTLVWSRGGALLRRFSFDSYDQDVHQALFVDFPDTSDARTQPAAPVPLASTSAHRLDDPRAGDEPLFGPYRRPATSSWSDDPLPLPRDPPATASCPSSSSTESASTSRTLLVLLSTVALAYPISSGGCVPIPLPFRVRRAWALGNGAAEGDRAGGVLLERAEAPRPGSAQHAAWYTLAGPLEPLRPVALREVPREAQDPAAAPPARKRLVDDSDERVVFASAARPLAASSSSPSSSTATSPTPPSVLVTTNERTRTLRVWRYERVELSPGGEDPDALEGEFGLGDERDDGDDDEQLEDVVEEGEAGQDGTGSVLGDMSLSSSFGASRKGKGKARAREPAADADVSGASASTAMRPSGSGGTKRKHASLSGGGGDASLAAPGGLGHGLGRGFVDERSVRRASGQGHGHAKPRLSGAAAAAAASRVLDQQEHDLLEALGAGVADPHGHAHGYAPAHGGHGHGRGGHGAGTTAAAAAAAAALTLVERRTSTSRNELSVTMDRMALSQGASSAGGGAGLSGALGLAHGLGGGLGDLMDREATLLLGGALGGALEGDSARRSECVLEAVWEADLHNLSTSGMTAYLFDVRSATSSTLAIHLPAAQVLLLLGLAVDPSGTLFANPVSELQALSAVPVLATRRDVLDLLYLRPDQSLALVTADGKEFVVPSPQLPLGRTIASLDGNGSSTVLLTLDDGSRRLTTFTPPEPGALATACLEALAAALPLDDYVKLQSAVFEREREHEAAAWARSKTARRELALQLVLDELFGAQPRAPPTSPFDEMVQRTSSSLEPGASNPLARLRASPSALAPPAAPGAPSPLREHDEAILLALHLLAQDARLASGSEDEVRALGRWVARLAAAKGLVGWVDYWRRLLGSSLDDVVCGPESHPGQLPASPPDSISHLAMLLAGKSPSSAAFDLGAFSAQLGLTPSSYYGSTSAPFTLTSQLVALYSHLGEPAASTASSASTSSSSSQATLARAQRVVLDMHSFGWTQPTLAMRVGFAVGLPLREAMRTCQLDAPEGWPSGAYELVARPDLARQVEGGAPPTWTGTSARDDEDAPSEVPSIDAILAQAAGPGGAGAATASARQEGKERTEKSLATVPRAARFNEDKRLEEVGRMLQYEQPAVISAGDRTLDQLTPQIQQSVLLALSARTLTLPVGQAMFLYRTKSTVPPDSIAIPRINTSARIIPMASPVALIEKEPRDPSSAPTVPDRLEWPDFHAGVAAALQLRVDPLDSGSEGATGLDSSQISFNRPAGDLDPRHAGLLLGLGLTGQLGAMHSSQAYEYLKAKHDPTSVGVLLGLAVSYLGTSDPTVTSVVSIHLTALHPPRSSSLNVSGMTKSAAAVALGLLHFGTGRRSYADILLREMCGVKVMTIEDGSLCREAYALSCGFAFGTIMLGRGRDKASTAKEGERLRTFRALILGEGNHALPGLSGASSAPDINITSPAATVAVALMYLRSERRDVADMLEIPDSLRTLDYVRPDLLLLRTLARNLILWKGIAKSKEWVEGQVPAFLSTALAQAGKAADPDLEVARWSIVAGACFAIGFKYAGTAAAEAHATLIFFLDRLTRSSFLKSASVQSKIKRHALRSSLGVVAVALSMVMAGTGELNVLRRLRVAHGMFSEGVTYGSHLATHMALGLLFLGQGKHTLGNSDAAVAALLLALYPAYPSSPTENRAHLQAYRHLWVLAVEPRYLEARDVETGEPVFLPIRLRLGASPDEPAPAPSTTSKTDAQAKQLVAPTLLPNLALIETIQVDSPRYWPFALRLSPPLRAASTSSPAAKLDPPPPTHLARFIRDGTLFVKRRTGHLSYAQDPRGVRSIFTRSKSETGSAVLDFGETMRALAPSWLAAKATSDGVTERASSALEDFVRAFSADAEALAVTQSLARPSTTKNGVSAPPPTMTEAFAASVLLECLTRDKREVAGVYHAVRDAWRAVDASEANEAAGIGALALLKTVDLRFVVDFYRLGTFKRLFVKPPPPPGAPKSTSAPREPLLHPSFVDHVSSRVHSHGQLAITERHTQAALKHYLDTLSWPAPIVRDGANQTLYHGSHALATVAAHMRLPAQPSLATLRTLVRAEGDKMEPASFGEVYLRLQRTRLAIEAQRGRGGAWDEEADEWMVEVWGPPDPDQEPEEVAEQRVQQG